MQSRRIRASSGSIFRSGYVAVGDKVGNALIDELMPRHQSGLSFDSNRKQSRKRNVSAISPRVN
jgi:hypothetical protein